MNGCTCDRVPVPCPVCERAIEDRQWGYDTTDVVDEPWTWIGGAA